MTASKAVNEPVEDPKKGKPRPQSKTQFPYYDLADAVKVADAIHTRAGGVCDRNQLAVLLNHKSVRSGAFLSRVAGAKMFGLVERANDFRLRVTQRGKAIVAPVDQQKTARAKQDAFFAVELFERVYEQYKGNTLPNNVGLQNLFGTDYGIVKSRRAPSVRIMLASAEYAGLFEMAAGMSQMVVPPVGLHEKTQISDQNAFDGDEPRHKQRGGGGNGNGSSGGQEFGRIDPAIIGLLQRLPPGGTPLSEKRREQLISAFTHVVAFIYPDPESDV